MILSDAAAVFHGVVLVIAPHMDDEVLACGATLDALPDKSALHVIYATDGALSPVPERLGPPRPAPELVAIRTAEACAALGELGIDAARADFLNLPDGTLRRRHRELVALLAARIRRLQPDHVFVPFRMDRHPDHLAVHRATVAALAQAGSGAVLNEYFVYFRWRLLPGGDVRRIIRSDRLVQVAPGSRESAKRRALACYASQTTRYYPWQTRAILTPANLDEVCASPEVFLQTTPATRPEGVFERLALWAHCAHLLEPRLKRCKEFGRRLLPGKTQCRQERDA